MTHTALQVALREHANLRSLVEKYPQQAPSLCQTLLDLTHASKWEHIQLIDLHGDDGASAAQLGGALLVGLRAEAKGLDALWSCSINDMLPTSQFKQIFTCLDRLNLADVAASDGKTYKLLTDHFLLAVHSPDATVVYYNIARGLVKPIN